MGDGETGDRRQRVEIQRFVRVIPQVRGGRENTFASIRRLRGGLPAHADHETKQIREQLRRVKQPLWRAGDAELVVKLLEQPRQPSVLAQTHNGMFGVYAELTKDRPDIFAHGVKPLDRPGPFLCPRMTKLPRLLALDPVSLASVLVMLHPRPAVRQQLR